MGSHRIMKGIRRALARSAWTAFLVLFAARAIACTPLCDLTDEHRAPSSASPATATHALAPHGAHDALKDQQASPADLPSHNADDQVCEEPAYISTQSVSASTFQVDAIPSSHAPALDWKLARVATNAFLPRLAHPPPPRSPLDISPRLRI